MAYPHEDPEMDQDHSDMSLSPSSSPSSSSSSSSSPSSSSAGGNAIPIPFSPVQTGLIEDCMNPVRFLQNGDLPLLIQRLKFLDTAGGGIKEWKNAEERFDRIALARTGSEPVVKWSDFGFCIGMQQSQEYAKELLRALRRGENINDEITKIEFHDYWRRLNDPSPYSRLSMFFDLCDKNLDGCVSEHDIKQMIWLSASANKLSLSHEEAEEYAALVMEVIDTGKEGHIELSQMETLLKIGLSKDTLSLSTAQSSSPYYHTYDHCGPDCRRPMSRPEVLFRMHWRRAWIVMLWLAICIALFTWKFIQYRHRAAFEVMGYCLCTAKGAAETLKLNMAVILLPVCRNTITWLRTNRRVSSVVPFNDNINFHKLIAGGIVIGVILHGGTHLACDFPRISGSDKSLFQQTIAANFGYHQPSYVQILTTTEVATGLIMVVLMAIAFSLATKWPRRQSAPLPRSVRNVTGYNTFWYSHHLLILVYVLLIIHSMFLFLTNDFIEKTTWMYLAFPVLLYTGERTFRAVRSSFYEANITKASVYTGKVLFLKFKKPQGFEYKSGMSISMQCPQISPLEWHPFSLTSGPEDDYLSVHMRTLGDWSYQMYCLFQEAILARANQYPKIYFDGPYGAASQDHIKYDTVALIGLGIGATPFISILKDVIGSVQERGVNASACRQFSNSNVPSKAYLYWVTREQSSFAWFRDFIQELYCTNKAQSIVEIHNFLTSMYKEDDARSALLSAIQVLYRAKTGADMISKTPVHTYFARPNWSSIFSKLSKRHRGGRIGVFYCGPSGLAKELEWLCTKFSTKTPTRFVFHKEHY